MIDQNAAGLPRAMLVGMAGTGHWSASVEVVEAGAAILFDIACRLRGPTPSLRSTYALEFGWGATRLEAAPGGFELAAGGSRMRGQIVTGELQTLSPLILGPAETNNSSSSARTLRWAYLLRA